MKRHLFGIFAVLFAGAAVLSNPCAAEDERRYGVVYNIAEDRKVEKVGGIYEPEGLDKYMKRKFDAFDAKLDSMNAKIDAIDAKVEKIMEAQKSEERGQAAQSGLVR